MQTLALAGLAEGAEIGGKYRLGSRCGASARQTDYATIYRGSPATIRIFRCETAGESGVLAAGFALAVRFPHANLLTVYDFGEDVISEGEQQGERIAWIVMERGDECLADILNDRALEEDEVRQLLEGILPPLEYLHERKLSHTDVSPSNIFACGDRIKLSSDRIAAETAEPAAAQAARLVREASGAVNPPCQPEAKPVTASAEASVPQPKYRKYAGLAIGGALAAAALCALLIRGAHETASTHQTVEVVAPAQAAPVQAAPVQAVGDSHSKVASGWAIVAGSFNRSAEAEKRAAEIAGSHAKLDVKVYAAGASGHRLVIVLGSGLSEAQAKKQLTQVRRNGAPRGTYITRFE